jgi:putative resolvase
MEKRYKLGEAAKYIGRHPKTLEKYDNKGILKAYRTKTNRRYYTKKQLDDFLNRNTADDEANKKIVAYARVSSNQQKDNLKNQMSFIKNYTNAKGLVLDEELSDIGFDWFDTFCKKHGCEIIVLNNIDTSPEQEVANDLISIMRVFSCRVYGLRKYKKVIEKAIYEKK